MDNLNDLLAAQNKRILTLQLLVEALVDELIETKKVKESKLDARFISKMELRITALAYASVTCI
jgi:hypothetical protein